MESYNCTVFTSLNNDKDEPTGVLNICSYNKFTDPRRNSRASKILAHKYINTEYSIYVDGNITLNVSPETLIEKYLGDHDIAVYKHPTRDCIYDEAIECAKRRLDDPEIIIEQAKAYEDSGYAKHKGLAECGVIIRRHTPEVAQFNEAWWAEYCRYSRRDQISFMFAVDKVGIRVNIIPDYFITQSPTTAIKQSGDLSIKTHKHYE
jgi:hypothetical protein